METTTELMLSQPVRVTQAAADLIARSRVHSDAIDPDIEPPSAPSELVDRLCPCQQHPIEYSGISIPPWWEGDAWKPVLVCPTPDGGSVVEGATEGYLYVRPGEEADRLNWRPVWAGERRGER